MTATLRRKRAIESRLGEPTEFRTANTDTGAAVELHSTTPWEPSDEQPFGRVAGGPTTLLGAGEDHETALADAEATLEARGVPARASRHGVYANPRRKITAPPEVFAAQDGAAARAGKPWAQWALDVLSAAAPVAGSDSRKKDPRVA